MNRRLLSLIFGLIVLSCSEWGGSNPVGVTGGSGTGYGKEFDTVPHHSSTSLIGSWKSIDHMESFDYAILTFYANGELEINLISHSSEYDFSFWRTYEVNGDTLTIINEDDISVSTFFIENDILYLTQGKSASSYIRV